MRTRRRGGRRRSWSCCRGGSGLRRLLLPWQDIWHDIESGPGDESRIQALTTGTPCPPLGTFSRKEALLRLPATPQLWTGSRPDLTPPSVHLPPPPPRPYYRAGREPADPSRPVRARVVCFQPMLRRDSDGTPAGGRSGSPQQGPPQPPFSQARPGPVRRRPPAPGPRDDRARDMPARVHPRRAPAATPR